jgi:hypothetical protein
MEATGEGLTAAEVEAAAREFRYARDLITAQDAEAWLTQWGLTVETWLAYLRRFVLRHKWAEQLADILAQCPVSPAEVEECITAAGICAGHFDRFAQKLAARAAVYERVKEAATPGPLMGVPRQTCTRRSMLPCPTSKPLGCRGSPRNAARRSYRPWLASRSSSNSFAGRP